VSFQITGALVGEEDVCVFQQVVEPGPIFLGVVQDGGAHPDLHVPGEGLELGVVWPPDVEDVRAVHGEIPADRRSRNDMTHSARANAVQRVFCVLCERHRVAFTDLLHRDQRHCGEDFFILRLIEKLFGRSYLCEHETFLRRGRLQFFCRPLQYGVPDRFNAVGAS
jgi:hypothetical protein